MQVDQHGCCHLVWCIAAFERAHDEMLAVAYEYNQPVTTETRLAQFAILAEREHAMRKDIIYSGGCVLEGLPERMVEKVTPVMACMAGTHASSPRCVALQGQVGERVRCAVYEQRPPVCRDVVPGDARCLEALQRHGLPPNDGILAPG